MKKHAVFFNSMAFGDCLFGINSARRFKEHNPDWLVSFVVRDNMRITTNDSEDSLIEAVEVFSKQPWIDAAGIAIINKQGVLERISLSKTEEEFKKIDLFIPQVGWWTDFGNNISNNYRIKEYLPEKILNDGNLELYVESEKTESNVLRIGMNGPLDWNRKLQKESLRLDIMYGIKDILDSRNMPSEINLFGVDVGDLSMYQSLCLLNTHDIFIGPIGSLHHASAALGLDTISIPSIFPVKLDCPEFYSKKGKHITVTHRKENHCGVYETKCLATKMYEDRDSKKFTGQEGPHASLGFWPRKCPHTTSGWSCTRSVVAKDVLDAFERWLDDRNK